MTMSEIGDMRNAVRMTRCTQYKSQASDGRSVLELFMKMFDCLEGFFNAVCELGLFGCNLKGKIAVFKIRNGDFRELEKSED